MFLFLKQQGCDALYDSVLMEKIIAKHETNDLVVSLQSLFLFPPFDWRKIIK